MPEHIMDEVENSLQKQEMGSWIHPPWACNVKFMIGRANLESGKNLETSHKFMGRGLHVLHE
jgi:hypothetical protein